MRDSDYFHNTKWILIAGLIIRLGMAPFTGHPYDLPIWQESGQLLASGISPYSPHDHLGQTILWALWTATAFLISSVIRVGQPYLYIFLIKLLPICADVAVAYAVLILLKEEGYNHDVANQRKAFSFIFLNPVFIIASSLWAMADSLAFFCLLLTYRYLRDGNWVRGSITMSVAIGLKLYPVILLPAFGFYLFFYQKNLFKAIYFSISSVMLFFVLAYFPFLFLPWEADELSSTLFDQTQRRIGGMSPFRIYTIIFDRPWQMAIYEPSAPYLDQYLLLRYLWAPILALLGLILLAIHYSDSVGFRKDSFQGWMDLTLLFYLLWYLTATWISEQNFVPIIGFVSIKLIIKTNSESKSSFESNIFALYTGLVLAHIIMNVPFNQFFYPVAPNSSSILQNQQFVRFRQIYLVSVIFLVLITTIVLISQLGNEFIQSESDGSVANQ